MRRWKRPLKIAEKEVASPAETLQSAFAKGRLPGGAFVLNPKLFKGREGDTQWLKTRSPATSGPAGPYGYSAACRVSAFIACAIGIAAYQASNSGSRIWE
jgi:hypothetical protein